MVGIKWRGAWTEDSPGRGAWNAVLKFLFWLYVTVVSAVVSVAMAFVAIFELVATDTEISTILLLIFLLVIPLAALVPLSEKKMKQAMDAWIEASPTKSTKADLPPIEEEEEVEAEEGIDVDAILEGIRAVNRSIADEHMSRQIEHIQDITQKILSYQEQRPEKASQLHSFLDYFLPATLKILRAYANLEEQGISGENITGAMKRIERMMDTVRQGFDKQLDLLYQGEAMDIATDVDVLERMMAKDGLIVNQDLSLRLEPGQAEKTENPY